MSRTTAATPQKNSRKTVSSFKQIPSRYQKGKKTKQGASPNYIDLSDTSFLDKQRTPAGGASSPIVLGCQPASADDGNGPSEFESNIQSIVDALKSQVKIRPLKSTMPWRCGIKGAYEDY